MGRGAREPNEGVAVRLRNTEPDTYPVDLYRFQIKNLMEREKSSLAAGSTIRLRDPNQQPNPASVFKQLHRVGEEVGTSLFKIGESSRLGYSARVGGGPRLYQVFVHKRGSSPEVFKVAIELPEGTKRLRKSRIKYQIRRGLNQQLLSLRLVVAVREESPFKSRS